MHVLITADTVGGVWTYTRELACGLVDQGHRVTLVSFGRMPDSSQVSWMTGRRVDYYPTAFPLEWMTDPALGVAESMSYLERIIRETRPDVLHLSQFCYGAIDCPVPKVLVAHSDVLTWWTSVHGEAPPYSPWMAWYRRTVSRGLRGADLVITPSRWMQKALQEHYELPVRCAVIYNSRTASQFRTEPKKQICVLSVGRIWDEAKQIRLLLARKHRVLVRIAGSSQHPDPSQRSSHIGDFGSCVEFCGEKSESELQALYAGSAAYAATSRYEPFGLALLEAALSKCALILNDIPVFRELWGDTAFYFNRNDADSLADAVSLVCEDVSLREEFGELAFERARSRFNPQRMIQEYEQAYESLVGKGAIA